MKRYSIVNYDQKGNATPGRLEESAFGQLVKYDDIAALKEGNERLTRELADEKLIVTQKSLHIHDIEGRLDNAEARVEELEGNYNDLLMCVQNKIPGVTRHDRAKQCILNWETGFSSSQHCEECTKGASQ